MSRLCVSFYSRHNSLGSTIVANSVQIEGDHLARAIGRIAVRSHCCESNPSSLSIPLTTSRARTARRSSPSRTQRGPVLSSPTPRYIYPTLFDLYPRESFSNRPVDPHPRRLQERPNLSCFGVQPHSWQAAGQGVQQPAGRVCSHEGEVLIGSRSFVWNASMGFTTTEL